VIRNGFSLVEALLAIALLGVMGGLTFYYLNISTLTSTQAKSQLQTHITLLSSMVLECKTLSESMPKQSGGANASSTLVSDLVCQTTPTYNLNGGRHAFVPKPPTGFDTYTATELGGDFFITFATLHGSVEAKVLESIYNGYLPTQATFNPNIGGKAVLNVYLAR